MHMWSHSFDTRGVVTRLAGAMSLCAATRQPTSSPSLALVGTGWYAVVAGKIVAK